MLNRKLRVLYADDDSDSRLMLMTLLGFSDIKVTTAGTVEEAWQLARTQTFDLYILDSRFPDGSGLSLCRRLRAFRPKAPIVFYSGLAFPADRRNGLAAGADAYVTKPNLDALQTAIQASAARRRSARATSPLASVCCAVN